MDVEVKTTDDGVSVQISGPPETLPDTREVRPDLERSLAEGGYRLDHFDTAPQHNANQEAEQDDEQDEAPPPDGERTPQRQAETASPNPSRSKRLLDRFA